MEKPEFGYMTENGYVVEEVFFEDISVEEVGANQLSWQEGKESFSANSLYEVSAALALSDTETKRFDIASIHGWPEFKTELKEECVKVLGKKICVEIPQLFTRMCHRKVYAELSYPKDFADTVKNDIIDCAKIAAIAAVAAAIATGAAGAAPVFEIAFKGCAKAKIKDLINQVKIDVNSDASCGDWTPR